MTVPGLRSVTASPAPTVTVPSAGRPDLSFITVTYGTGPIVVDMIDSLVASLVVSGLEFEVIVVDNPHSAHGRRSMIELTLFTSGVTIVTAERNLGFGGGCELGALHASAAVLAFVNPDVVFTSGWLEPLIARLRPGDDSASMVAAPSIVAPMLLEPDGTIQECGQRLLSTGHTVPMTDPSVGVTADRTGADYASAACWIMTSEEHERLGGFDPSYHPAYFEDVDLALRARRLGGGTAVETAVAVVHHRGSGTPGASGPATDQHATLLAKWPEIRWQQPLPADVSARRSF